MNIDAVWQRAMIELQESGVYIDEDEQDLVACVRSDFENVSASAQDQPGFDQEAPRLAAWMVSYAIERDRMGLTDYETF